MPSVIYHMQDQSCVQDLVLNVPFLVLSLVLADSFVKSRCGF